MLFRALDTYLLRTAPIRHLPHLTTYIATLNIRRVIITQRHSVATGYESPLIVLLRNVLNTADITRRQGSSDLDIYTNTLIYTHHDLNAIFDSTTTGRSFSGLLVPHRTPATTQILIPVSTEDPLAMLPLDRGWGAWQHLRALRLVECDSLELSFQLLEDQLLFRTTPPSQLILTLDTTALVLQYLNYLRTPNAILTQAEYLHRYVVTPLLDDLEDLWLASVYTSTITHTRTNTLPARCTLASLGDGYWGYPGVEISSGLNELAGLVRMCQGGGITPATVLASLPLSNTRVPEYLRHLLIATTLEEARQYLWMEYLRDLRWMQLLIEIYRLQPQYVGTRNLLTALSRDLPILMNLRIWTNCHTPQISAFIQSSMQDLFETVMALYTTRITNV